MFTGIIQHIGRVHSSVETPDGRLLCIDASGWEWHPDPGQSVAVNGCCLTVVHVEEMLFFFDVVLETLSRTRLGSLAIGDCVNLEHALVAGDLLSGHIVQGHVEGTVRVRACTTEGGEYRLHIDCPPAFMGAVVPQGSVVLDGVSLTVAAVGDSFFDVVLVPYTRRETTLGSVRIG